MLPSSHEGLPIALLEALSYGLCVVVSDIPANLEVGLPEGHYYPTGDIPALTERVSQFTSATLLDSEKANLKRWVAERYDWHKIANATFDLYQKVC